MTDLTERLRECPFCGGEATIVVSDLRPCNVDGWTDGYSVFCRESVRCSGRLPKFHKTRDEAIAAWNKRPTLETLTQENARLREAGWRDIESAPREHLARFLAYAEPRSDTEQVVFEVTRYDDKWGNHIRLNEGYGSSTERDILKRLTHWMPLPPAPARKALGGGDDAN